MISKEKINLLFVDVFNDILQIEEKALKNAGLENLSIKEIHVLEAIAITPEPTMSKVAAKLRVTIGTLTTAVNTLVKKEYVERVDCKDDRRVVRLKLTNTGVGAYDVHKVFHEDMVNNTLDGLIDKEVEVLATALTKMREFFINYN